MPAAIKAPREEIAGVHGARIISDVDIAGAAAGEAVVAHPGETLGVVKIQ